MVYTGEQVKAALQGQCQKAGSLRKFAETKGFSASYISDVLLSKRGISDRLADALGYQRQVTFKRKPI